MRITIEHNKVVKKEVNEPAYGFALALQWDENEWKRWFADAVRRVDRYDIRDSRREVFLSTLEIINQGWGYVTTEGNYVNLKLDDELTQSTKFYAKEIHPVPLYEERYATEVFAVKCDCLTVAREERKGQDDVCVLNMASRQNPGGGVINGAGAQEEYLFRCSDYYRSLYQYADFAPQYGLPRSSFHSYPLDRNFGGCFSTGVTVFRATEEEGYRLLNHPWRANFIAVPGMNKPDILISGGEERVAPYHIEGVKNKMRTIFRIAVDNGQKVLVLGALGCGAFRNPPKHTAELFKDVLEEEEFGGVFKRVIFAIKEDHNSRGSGNYRPFADVFNGGR